MYEEEPVLSEFIAAGDEINLALLEIDFKEFATAGDRDLARRAVISDMMAKHRLRDRREAMLSQRGKRASCESADTDQAIRLLRTVGDVQAPGHAIIRRSACRGKA